MVTGVEMFRKLLDQGEAGDNIGALLRGVGREDVERGQVLAKPGSITPHTNFEAEAYILTKEEGGRHTPFFTNYRPQFYFRTTDVTGVVTLPEGTEMVMPGDNARMVVELIQPIAMDEGLRFAIREGGRTVGAGVVTKDRQVGYRERLITGQTTDCRSVAQLVEHRSPKPRVGGSSPSTPANSLKNSEHDEESSRIRPRSPAEVAKVTWPTRRETMITTSMVFIFVVIAALFFLVADKIIGFVVKLLLGVS